MKSFPLSVHGMTNVQKAMSPLDSLKSQKSTGGLCPGQETTLATRDRVEASK